MSQSEPQRRVDQPVELVATKPVFDVNAIFDGKDFSVSPAETPDDARHRRHRALVAFYAALAVLAAIFVAAMAGIISPNTHAEDKKWYFGVVGAIATGAVAYLFKNK